MTQSEIQGARFTRCILTSACDSEKHGECEHTIISVLRSIRFVCACSCHRRAALARHTAKISPRFAAWR